MVKRMLGAAVMVAVAGAMLAGPAVAGASPSSQARVITKGTCSGASTWKLTLKHDAGRIESDLEVQSHVSGQVWHYKMTDNGIKFAGGNKTTVADGSFSVTRFAPNAAGADNIVARATNRTTGEVCRASGTI